MTNFECILVSSKETSQKKLDSGISLSMHCLEMSPYKNADTENLKLDKF